MARMPYNYTTDVGLCKKALVERSNKGALPRSMNHHEATIYAGA